jgi:hypothetical protein
MGYCVVLCWTIAATWSSPAATSSTAFLGTAPGTADIAEVNVTGEGSHCFQAQLTDLPFSLANINGSSAAALLPVFLTLVHCDAAHVCSYQFKFLSMFDFSPPVTSLAVAALAGPQGKATITC